LLPGKPNVKISLGLFKKRVSEEKTTSLVSSVTGEVEHHKTYDLACVMQAKNQTFLHTLG